MPGTTLAYAVRKHEIQKMEKVKSLLWNQTMDHPQGSPYYYSVLYYGKSSLGGLLDSEDYRKRWDRSEVVKTHGFVSRLICKSFGDVPLWWSLERHDDYEDYAGEKKKGSFHSNLYIGHIPDEVIEDPSPYLMPLFYKEDESGVPINMRAVDMENLKLLLLNACIRQSKWVGRHPDSLFLAVVPPDEMEATFRYGLKDITPDLDNFDQVIDWKNSSFYTPH